MLSRESLYAKIQFSVLCVSVVKAIASIFLHFQCYHVHDGIYAPTITTYLTEKEMFHVDFYHLLKRTTIDCNVLNVMNPIAEKAIVQLFELCKGFYERIAH